MKKKLPLIIASKNIHKIREIKAILKNCQFLDLMSLLDFPDYIPPEEKENSFEENAIEKAVDAAKNLNHWVLADDSGLVVPALNGLPGVKSARFAGEDASDADNRKKLLDKMKNLEGEDRDAYFICCLALSSPKGIKKSVCATCEGMIIENEKGGSGFGYDPLFVKHEYSKTFAELEEQVKNKISHRAKAIDKILFILESVAK